MFWALADIADVTIKNNRKTIFIAVIELVDAVKV
jgi:hypothetical protein